MAVVCSSETLVTIHQNSYYTGETIGSSETSVAINHTTEYYNIENHNPRDKIFHEYTVYFFANLFNDEILAFGADSIMFLVQCSDVKVEVIPFKKSYTYFIIAITKSWCV
jgi:hypothetical protein